ncbi:ATP-binding cassette, subfamily G (WHITE), member 8 (sterolin 2), partial [Nematocida sp. AWRm77]
NASFSLRKGKMTALIGLSGEGKSTLMNAIVGLDKSNKKAYGEILVEENGEMVPRDPVKWFQRVGYVRQGFINYKNMPVMDILKSVCKCYGQSEEKIEVFLGKLRMQKTKNTKYKNLSGGEQRRIMTIIGLLNNAELNIWDEPLTGLDSEIAHTSLTMMRASGKTNLVSVHQVSDDLMKLFDDLIVVHNTTIIYSGPIENTHSYFGQHNVSFPTDIFYINYIIRLSAGNTNTTEDIQNVENFNKLADSILNKETEKTQPAIKPRMFVPFSMPNITRIKEVYKRSLFFNKKVRGEHFIIDTLFHFLLIVGTSIILYLMKQMATGGSNIALNDITEMTVNMIKSLNVPKSESSTIFRCLGWIRNINIFFIEYIASLVIYMPLTSYACGYLSTLINKEYYALCCQCIEEKQFTNVDMICAILFDLFIRKFVFCFVTFFIVIEIIHNNGTSILLKKIEGQSTFGHIAIINCAFLFSLLVYLYSVIVNFFPLPSKLIYSLVPILCTLFMSIPYVLYTVDVFEEKGFPMYTKLDRTNFNTMFATPEDSYAPMDMMVDYEEKGMKRPYKKKSTDGSHNPSFNEDKPESDNSDDSDTNSSSSSAENASGDDRNHKVALEERITEFKKRYEEITNKQIDKMNIFQKVIFFLANRCRDALRYSPPSIVLEYYTKLGLYTDSLPFVVTDSIIEILKEARDSLTGRHQKGGVDGLLSKIVNSNSMISQETANSAQFGTDDISVMSEIFEIGAPLPSCGIIRVAWGLLRFFLFPSIFLFILMVYSYKSLQPSLK